MTSTHYPRPSYTQFKIIRAGDLEHLKDKTVQQDKVIKLQKQSCEHISANFAFRRSEMGIEHNTDIVPEESKTNDVPLSTKSTPTVTKAVVFLCDLNEKYI